MISDAKIEANRRNAKKSKGPTSDEGKVRSRLNALKHGMRANLLVLPGEDPEALKARVDAWTADLRPRNEVEQYLVDRAAAVSWQLDRVDRAHVARLTSNIRSAATELARAEQDDVLVLGRRLFWDERGPMPLYPHATNDYDRAGKQPPVSWTGVVPDPNLPSQVLLSLESSAAGCAWLLDRWAELRTLLEQGKTWQSPDKLKAIRLLGCQPLDAFDDNRVAVVFLACHKIDPGDGPLFYEIWKELTGKEIKIIKRRLESRPLDALEPSNADEARKTLFHLIDQAVDRLKPLAASLQNQAEAEASLSADILAFDDSAEGERFRRYETTCSRNLLRTLDEFFKVRKAGDSTDRSEPIINAPDDRPVTCVDFEPGVEHQAPIVPDPPDEPIAGPGAILNGEMFTTESSRPATTGNHDDQPNEPTTAASPRTDDQPNEPTAATGPHQGRDQRQSEPIVIAQNGIKILEHDLYSSSKGESAIRSPHRE
jgi:hypothetical protein